jgi:GntR family transcriptional regulator
MEVESKELDVFEQLRRPDPRGVPKYVRLSEALIEAIKEGRWKPGDKLPPEEELAQSTPFSLGTVQRALRNLAEQGIVVRQQGLGSFVANIERRMKDPWHCRFVADDGETILPIYTKTIKRELVNERGPWSRYFTTAPGRVIRIDRLINVNNEFTIFSQFFTDRQLLKRLWECPLGKLDGENFKLLITRECNLPTTDVTRDVSIVRMRPDIAKAIRVKAKSVGLLLQAIARAGRETCVYYQEFYIPPTKRALRFSDGDSFAAVG